jgi:hypothetical protein
MPGQVLVLGHGLAPVGRGAQGCVRGVGTAVGHVPLEALAAHVEGILALDAHDELLEAGYHLGGDGLFLGLLHHHAVVYYAMLTAFFLFEAFKEDVSRLVDVAAKIVSHAGRLVCNSLRWRVITNRSVSSVSIANPEYRSPYTAVS